MSIKTPTYCLTIAGHDPSAGAGLLADIKTFEAHKVYGLSICTAITIQNDVSFNTSYWVPIDQIVEQLQTLAKRFTVEVVKIGIVESWSILLQIITQIKLSFPSIKIVLDPILKASAGFQFHSDKQSLLFTEIAKQCFVITPNYEELMALYTDKNEEETLSYLSKHTNVYLKGGHRPLKKGWDTLYLKNGKSVDIPPITSKIYQKHGSGCVLSSTLASNLALGKSLENAAVLTKNYVEQFLNSNSSLLGNHNYSSKNI